MGIAVSHSELLLEGEITLREFDRKSKCSGESRVEDRGKHCGPPRPAEGNAIKKAAFTCSFRDPAKNRTWI